MLVLLAQLQRLRLDPIPVSLMIDPTRRVILIHTNGGVAALQGWNSLSMPGNLLKASGSVLTIKSASVSSISGFEKTVTMIVSGSAKPLVLVFDTIRDAHAAMKCMVGMGIIAKSHDRQALDADQSGGDYGRADRSRSSSTSRQYSRTITKPLRSTYGRQQQYNTDANAPVSARPEGSVYVQPSNSLKLPCTLYYHENVNSVNLVFTPDGLSCVGQGSADSACGAGLREIFFVRYSMIDSVFRAAKAPGLKATQSDMLVFLLTNGKYFKAQFVALDQLKLCLRLASGKGNVPVLSSTAGEATADMPFEGMESAFAVGHNNSSHTECHSVGTYTGDDIEVLARVDRRRVDRQAPITYLPVNCNSCSHKEDQHESSSSQSSSLDVCALSSQSTSVAVAGVEVCPVVESPEAAKDQEPSEHSIHETSATETQDESTSEESAVSQGEEVAEAAGDEGLLVQDESSTQQQQQPTDPQVSEPEAEAWPEEEEKEEEQEVVPVCETAIEDGEGVKECDGDGADNHSESESQQSEVAHQSSHSQPENPEPEEQQGGVSANVDKGDTTVSKSTSESEEEDWGMEIPQPDVVPCTSGDELFDMFGLADTHVSEHKEKSADAAVGGFDMFGALVSETCCTQEPPVYTGSFETPEDHEPQREAEGLGSNIPHDEHISEGWPTDDGGDLGGSEHNIGVHDESESDQATHSEPQQIPSGSVSHDISQQPPEEDTEEEASQHTVKEKKEEEPKDSSVLLSPEPCEVEADMETETETETDTKVVTETEEPERPAIEHIELFAFGVDRECVRQLALAVPVVDAPSVTAFDLLVVRLKSGINCNVMNKPDDGDGDGDVTFSTGKIVITKDRVTVSVLGIGATSVVIPIDQVDFVVRGVPFTNISAHMDVAPAEVEDKYVSIVVSEGRGKVVLVLRFAIKSFAQKAFDGLETMRQHGDGQQ